MVLVEAVQLSASFSLLPLKITSHHPSPSVMDLLKTVLKVENHTKEPLNIRGIFARCGEIPSLYPYDAGVSGASLYFMKFTNIENAERAIGLELGGVGIRVYPISTNPQLIKQYRSTNPSDFDSYGRPRRTSTSNAPKDTLDRRRGSTSVVRAEASGVMHLEFSRDRNLSNAASYTSKPLVMPMQGSSKSSGTGGGDAHVTPRQPSSSTPLLTPVTNVKDDLNSQAPTVVVSSIDAAPSTSAFPLSFSNTITMSLSGGAITFDLQELQQDPQVIIDILKLTQSERGNWMIVAANYRRSSNTPAAVSVLDAMTTELMKRGVSEQDLKPAFLMLSGCEVELAKKAKEKKDTAAASVHYRAAQKWLQRVFGEGAPPPGTLARLQPFNVAPTQTTSTMATDSSRLSSRSIPTSPSASRSIPTSPLASRLKVPIPVSPTTPGTPSISTPTKPFGAIPTKPGYSISLSQHRVLERELQSQRDRNHDQALLLSEVRNVKRKLEEDNEHERNLRRKLQRKLDELEKERDDARRLETYALDQIKREVSIRRKAEERAEKEHELRMELVKATAERNIDTKVVFEDLGNAHNVKAGHIGNENTPPDAGA